jgi:hypothetical protein
LHAQDLALDVGSLQACSVIFLTLRVLMSRVQAVIFDSRRQSAAHAEAAVN